MTSRAPRHQTREWIFKKLLLCCGAAMLILITGIFITLLYKSWPAIHHSGLNFITGETWDAMGSSFGAKPFLYGTLLTSFLALLISIPFSLSLAILLGEYHPKGWFSEIFKLVINILAGIPSVIYGFWGLFVVVPWIRTFETYAGIVPYGIGIATASIILAIMIIPYAAALGRDVIASVPNELKEAAYSLGATQFEVLTTVILPYSRSSLFAGTILALGRAIGETMAVTMVIGNTNAIPNSIFAPGNTMASVIANEFSEATELLHTASLIELGLYLFVITAIINLIGKWIIKRTEVAYS